MVTLTTIPLLFFIYRHYNLDLQFQKAKETLDPHGIINHQNLLIFWNIENIRTSGHLKMMIVECIICGLHSPPKINAEIRVPQ